MSLFIRLLAGHLLGDFLFQTDEIYAIRKKSFIGSSPHYLIILVSLLASAFPYLRHLSCWVVIASAWVAHIAQDELKLKFFPSSSNLFVFILDQALHIAILMPVLGFPYAYGAPMTAWGISAVYDNNAFVIVLIGYIIAIFVGAYFWAGYLRAFSKKTQHAQGGENSKFGMWERALIMTVALDISLWALLLVVAGLRILNKKKIAAFDLIFNLVYCLVIGFTVRQVLLR